MILLLLSYKYLYNVPTYYYYYKRRSRQCFPACWFKMNKRGGGGTLFKIKNNICHIAYYIIIIYLYRCIQRMFCFPEIQYLYHMWFLKKIVEYSPCSRFRKNKYVYYFYFLETLIYYHIILSTLDDLSVATNLRSTLIGPR